MDNTQTHFWLTLLNISLFIYLNYCGLQSFILLYFVCYNSSVLVFLLLFFVIQICVNNFVSTDLTNLFLYYFVDQVIENILNSSSKKHWWFSWRNKKNNKKLEDARKILQRVMTRDLYRCLGEATVCSYVFMCLYYKSNIHP